MGEVKEPYEGGTGSLLEVVDMMCDVTEKLAGIVRKQAALIEQERIADVVFPADLSEERRQAEDDLDRIEMKLRNLHCCWSSRKCNRSRFRWMGSGTCDTGDLYGDRLFVGTDCCRNFP